MLDLIERNKWGLYSVSIAMVVMMLDIRYAEDNFESVDTFLIVAMMIQIHIAFIVLPYMGSSNVNKFMIGVFFLAALLPASLQISSESLDKMEKAIRTEPTVPTAPLLDKGLDSDIKRAGYYLYQASINKKATVKLQTKLSKLQGQKKGYLESLTLYNKAVQEYPDKKAAYEEYVAKSGLSFIFDYLNLLFPFVAIVGLQVMSGYSSKIGAARRQLPVKDEQPTEPVEPNFKKPEKKKINFPWTPTKKVVKKSEPAEPAEPGLIKTDQIPLPSPQSSPQLQKKESKK